MEHSLKLELVLGHVVPRFRSLKLELELGQGHVGLGFRSLMLVLGLGHVGPGFRSVMMAEVMELEHVELLVHKLASIEASSLAIDHIVRWHLVSYKKY